MKTDYFTLTTGKSEKLGNSFILPNKFECSG